MAEILFVTWDECGDLPPALGLGPELRARGHAVRFLGHSPRRRSIVGAGFTGGGGSIQVRGASACATSGQNEGFHDGTEVARVQSFGRRLRIGAVPPGVPGRACNPSWPAAWR